ncbi:MAG: SDR family NAD(P)-dependent oxidoreductase [Bacteroidaceae bacterium]|nr:SDR family NAD(P)-dependent oxidoreductase [Bacteroidaceae bacterium]
MKHGRSKDIRGYNALVTGGTSGMGWEYCRQLAAMGCNVLMVSVQKDLLATLPDKITEEYGVKSWGLYMDLSKESAADELWDWCRQQQLDIDILVNNAGMFFFHELDADTHDKALTMLRLHVDTPTRLVMLFGEPMKERHRGYIVNMSSMTAQLPTPGTTVYSATKAYLKSFSKSMYFELAPYGVGVTTVLPAAVATPLYRMSPRMMKLGVAVGLIRTPQRLVKRALRGMLHRRHVVKPGATNYILPVLIKLLPNWLEQKIWNKIKVRSTDESN